MRRASLSSRSRKSATLSTEARHSPIMLMAKGKKRVMDSRTVLYSASARNAFSAVSTFTGSVNIDAFDFFIYFLTSVFELDILFHGTSNNLLTVAPLCNFHHDSAMALIFVSLALFFTTQSLPCSPWHYCKTRGYLLTLTDNLTLLTLDLCLGSAHPYTANLTQLTLALSSDSAQRDTEPWLWARCRIDTWLCFSLHRALSRSPCHWSLTVLDLSPNPASAHHFIDP